MVILLLAVSMIKRKKLQRERIKRHHSENSDSPIIESKSGT